MADSISSVLVDCLKLFNTLISRTELASYSTEVPMSLWTDELGRLRLWAGNIGAHQTGQSSLDYRLRDASHIKGQTVKLLERLRQNLQDLDELLDGIDLEDEEFLLQEDDETEAQQIYGGIVTTVDCLFQISMIIRRPTQHDRLLGTKKLDATAFEPFDKQHVAHKYPQAPRVVADRLGAAISRRRAVLKYRERHHAKLGQGIDEPDALSTRLSETIATDFEETHIDFEETGSNSGLSQTSYATSLWESGDKIIVPRPPKESSGGKPFECPYCFYFITVSNRRSWIRHVFRDLMPYVCVFPECTASNRLYCSRREWFQHLRSRHLSGSAPGDKSDCPLHCGASLPAISIERHLGKHLEELALFALPRMEEDDGDDNNEDSLIRTLIRELEHEGEVNSNSSSSSSSSDGMITPGPSKPEEESKSGSMSGGIGSHVDSMSPSEGFVEDGGNGDDSESEVLILTQPKNKQIAREEILLEAKREEEEMNIKAAKMKEKFLMEEEARIESKKQKKKAEVEEFERKVKEKFMNAGATKRLVLAPAWDRGLPLYSGIM
ncbi:uncharacterized protein Z520_08257 [Fonsecaea multimorphosa CBS 102226]|uniref:Oxidoreductase acuF-like C2H2 type zinc-finger domain-containing protein n=1 Tax=Fonsecaea multimorphosa CBS 102226 TaxID=1442371 RepID=A0A0D2JRG5_9EURO|nr:uncharacterized protein Z520_08257 [Fonsecaea multimorphosa CBS 102226]KIX96002.1 hypothetical protein Z520_08257 [Fonsecaea multimorphosa CBS 102226]